MIKRKTLPLVFSGEIFENGWLWTAASEESNRSGVALVNDRYSEQSVCNLTKRRTLPPVFSGQISKMDGCGQLPLNSSR